MEIPFSYGGVGGVVDVRCAPMTDPVSLGKATDDLGVPSCTAAVHFSALGYWALLGWVQLVAMGPPGEVADWASDPFELFDDSTSPYAWFGIRPTLFDAPSRRSDIPLRGTIEVREPARLPDTAWQAHLPYLRTRYSRWTFRG